MRIKVIGENNCARALRGLLRKGGFAVSEFLPAAVVREMPSGGYVIRVEESREAGQILFDSVDCEFERNILRHVTQLSPNPVMGDRPGRQVHRDREIRIVVPAEDEREQQAVEFGVLRGVLDTVSDPGQRPAATPWYRRWFG